MLDRIADSTLVKVITPQLSSDPLGGDQQNANEYYSTICTTYTAHLFAELQHEQP
jgi:hypothetical protein